MPTKPMKLVMDENDTTSDPLGPLNVLHALYGLWASRVISQDAFFLGAQVIHRMDTHKVLQVNLTGEEAQGHLVRLNGAIYAGPIGKSMPDYITALQDLHFRGGLINDIGEAKLYDAAYLHRHFTLSPQSTAGYHWSFKTPIYFRVIQLGKTEFFQAANKLAAASLTGCLPLDIESE